MTNLCPNFPYFYISCREEVPVYLALAYEILKPKGNYRKFLGKIIFINTNKGVANDALYFLWSVDTMPVDAAAVLWPVGGAEWHRRPGPLMASFSVCLDLPAWLRMSWNVEKKESTSICLRHCSKFFCYLQSNINLTDVFYAHLNMWLWGSWKFGHENVAGTNIV